MERRLVHAAAAAGRHRRDVRSHANIRHVLSCGGAPWLRRERARRRPQTAARQAGACACGAVRVNIARAIHRTLRLTTSACSPPPQRPPEQDEQASASAPSTDRETAAAADAGGWEFERVVNVANGISLARGLSSPLLYYWIVHVRSLATAATPPHASPSSASLPAPLLAQTHCAAPAKPFWMQLFSRRRTSTDALADAAGCAEACGPQGFRTLALRQSRES